MSTNLLKITQIQLIKVVKRAICQLIPCDLFWFKPIHIVSKTFCLTKNQKKCG